MEAYLANEVRSSLFVLLGYSNCVLPDGVITLVGLARLQLGHNVELLLLLKVLVES